MILALTGHRPNKLGGEYNHVGPVSSKIITVLMAVILDNKPEYIITGMALGADTLWAYAAIATETPFIAAIPFKGQENAWPHRSQVGYYELLGRAKEIVVVCQGGYAPWKMQKRNEYMVDHCDRLVAVWDGSSGGTANCVAYAKTIGKPIDRINPRLL
jgi:uncharacterized phage-like protein YoqJ